MVAENTGIGDQAKKTGKRDALSENRLDVLASIRKQTAIGLDLLDDITVHPAIEPGQVFLVANDSIVNGQEQAVRYRRTDDIGENDRQSRDYIPGRHEFLSPFAERLWVIQEFDVFIIRQYAIPRPVDRSHSLSFVTSKKRLI